MQAQRESLGVLVGVREKFQKRQCLGHGTGEQQITLSPEPEAKVMWENKPLTPQGVTVVHRVPEDRRISFKKEEREFLKMRPRFMKVH